MRNVKSGGIAKGQTVLVTTGRQAKTLHIVRALKEVGATVIVTDYDHISASALSLACDKFVALPSLGTNNVQSWIQNFRDILVENNVDMVLPVSTINEVLFIGLAKRELEQELTHIQWLCPDLELALMLDDRSKFLEVCERYMVPAPEGGVLKSPARISKIADQYENGVMLKRIESSVNRQEEIVHIEPNGVVPSFVNPTVADAWQWQRFIRGKEFSVWYVCVNGHVTFTSCYISEADLTHFDPVSVDEDLDRSLRNLIKALKLTGQFAFDFIQDAGTGRCYVIECNPRASSILETVSKTPSWGECFFGLDVTHRTVYNSVGFLYHFNCWPWSSRIEGYFDLLDPLPFFGAELVWPMNAIATKGLGEKLYHKIDVNICKIIIEGQSTGRNLAGFRDELSKSQLRFILTSLEHIDTLLLDVSIPDADALCKKCHGMGVEVSLFRDESTSMPPCFEGAANVAVISHSNITEAFLVKHLRGETRILLGSKLSMLTGSLSNISYRIVKPNETWSVANEVPLRKLRILHVMGSVVNEFYETLSTRYGYECIENVGTEDRFEHIIAHVHPSGHWSVENFINETFSKKDAARISPGAALNKIDGLGIDLILPHMFDYEGLTSVRSVFNILKIPMIGCTAEALALSTNKARTNACARVAGIRVPDFEVLRKGDMPSMKLPFVVKPSEEDNSQGITVVRETGEIDGALDHAFQFCEEVLCEEFIAPGREVRVGIIEKGDGSLEMLPVIEYFVSESDPVRTTAHKLDTTKTGSVTKLVGGAPGGVTLPAKIDDELHSKLYQMVSTAHKALGCRDYSIYDIRINPEGEPVMLESCLYCSFAPTSVLVKMQAASGIDKRQLFNRLSESALTRRVAFGESKGGTAMK
ncbi:D-alanine--D-alanine ligase [Gracilaria domingensis]|nr:D-alanine--D-alanine ligase [Gracilaria domingensis]